MPRRLAGSALEEKLLLNSVRDGECLRWTGAHTAKGYGQIIADGRKRPVHVVAHEIWIGPVPSTHEVDHVRKRGCRFRDCIEAAHLEAVTHAENVRRQVESVTHCVQGHEFTLENTKRVLVRGKYEGRRCRACFNADRKRRKEEGRRG